MKTEMTTGDAALDKALNALMTACTFNDEKAMELADNLEQKFFHLEEFFNKYLGLLRQNLSNAKARREKGIAVDLNNVDISMAFILHVVTDFYSDICRTVEDFHACRADTVSKAVGVNQNLAQAIVDYAVKRKKTETCASDSEMTTF